MAISINDSSTNRTNQRRSVLELSAREARQFFVKHESYCTIDLPPYINFGQLLAGIAESIHEKEPRSMWGKPREHDGVNYVILGNKDGKYSWRPLELIHPALYVALANEITEESQWSMICERFRAFDAPSDIQCLSIPVESGGKTKDKAEQINRWWEGFEQRSVELSLDYQFVIHTDIVDCYAAIYTHSIAWALHTKPFAKSNRDRAFVGNAIDQYIQDMHLGQTNGIPQGAVLMDFIAEMVLGYADVELAEKIDCTGIKEYSILRYRDDYRIFVNSTRDGEAILKVLTEVMMDLGLKLGEAKTDISGEVIRSSIKADKLDWLFRKQTDRQLQRRLLIILDHSIEHPNSGSLIAGLQRYYSRLLKTRRYDHALSLIAIVVDIAYRNPRSYFVCAAILSKLISLLAPNEDRHQIIHKIRKKFEQIPNTGHLDIWMQRIVYPFDPDMEFAEPICKLVSNGYQGIWNNDWITNTDLRKNVDARMIIDQTELGELKPIVPLKEISLFGFPY